MKKLLVLILSILFLELNCVYAAKPIKRDYMISFSQRLEKYHNEKRHLLNCLSKKTHVTMRLIKYLHAMLIA